MDSNYVYQDTRDRQGNRASYSRDSKGSNRPHTSLQLTNQSSDQSFSDAHNHSHVHSNKNASETTLPLSNHAKGSSSHYGHMSNTVSLSQHKPHPVHMESGATSASNTSVNAKTGLSKFT